MKKKRDRKQTMKKKRFKWPWQNYPVSEPATPYALVVEPAYRSCINAQLSLERIAKEKAEVEALVAKESRSWWLETIPAEIRQAVHNGAMRVDLPTGRPIQDSLLADLRELGYVVTRSAYHLTIEWNRQTEKEPY